MIRRSRPGPHARGRGVGRRRHPGRLTDAERRRGLRLRWPKVRRAACGCYSRADSARERRAGFRSFARGAWTCRRGGGRPAARIRKLREFVVAAAKPASVADRDRPHRVRQRGWRHPPLGLAARRLSRQWGRIILMRHTGVSVRPVPNPSDSVASATAASTPETLVPALGSSKRVRAAWRRRFRTEYVAAHGFAGRPTPVWCRRLSERLGLRLLAQTSHQFAQDQRARQALLAAHEQAPLIAERAPVSTVSRPQLPRSSDSTAPSTGCGRRRAPSAQRVAHAALAPVVPVQSGRR